jgi:hypothetical protein
MLNVPFVQHGVRHFGNGSDETDERAGGTSAYVGARD